MLVAPDLTLARKETLALTSDQVRWLVNGKAFLAHLRDLPRIGLAAFCQTCYQQGLPDDVMAGKSDETYVLRCAHQQQTLPTSAVGELQPLLARLGWSLHCTAQCARLGMFDGVQGFNDPHAPIVSVTCGCTERKFLR